MARDSIFAATLANYLGLAGYAASLDTTGLMPTAQLATGATSTTVFYRGDRTFAVPVGTPNTKLSGDVVQMVGVSVLGFTTTNGVHAGGFDNVPIGSAEGSTFGLSINLKPTAIANKVYVKGDFYGASSAVTAGLFWGLFLAASSSAVIAGGSNGLVTNDLAPMGFLWQATTVSTATTSYVVRLGTAAAAGTLTLNGQSAAGLFGNAVESSLTVWEVQN